MLGPTFLKVRLGVDEVVTTLLLNFVVLLFVQMMLEGPFKDPMGGGWPQSEPILDAGALPPLVERMRLHGGFLIAVALAAALHIVMTRTVFGLKMRAVGDNVSAARYAGIGVTGLMLAVGFLSGALAGLAGASEVAGLKGYLTADLSRGFGYAGIVVAMVAGLRPLWVVPSALFIAGIFVGADTMSRTIGVSNYIADLIVALALLCVLVSGLFTRYRIRWR
jgi:simple sugar transport system permease protein